MGYVSVEGRVCFQLKEVAGMWCLAIPFLEKSVRSHEVKEVFFFLLDASLQRKTLLQNGHTPHRYRLSVHKHFRSFSLEPARPRLQNACKRPTRRGRRALAGCLLCVNKAEVLRLMIRLPYSTTEFSVHIDAMNQFHNSPAEHSRPILVGKRKNGSNVLAFCFIDFI